MRWVARPPSPVRPYRQAHPRARYTGPPSYPAAPRWGFPQLVWRWPTALPGLGTSAGPVELTVRLARQLGLLLPALAAVSGLAAVGEVWRYVLLVRSLSGPLGAPEVLAADLLVTISGLFAVLGSALTTVVGVLWFVRARRAAAEATGLRPARPDWQVLLGALLPGANLLIPGSAVAELEHTALGRPAARRPRPGRLVLAWWVTWAGGCVLLVITALGYLGSSAQAQADAVLWHALADAVAVLLAVLSLRLVHYLTALLAPVDLGRTPWLRVIRVTGAPAPALRTVRPADSRR